MTGATEDQIKENQKDNFKAAQTLNQAIRRYNQLFLWYDGNNYRWRL